MGFGIKELVIILVIVILLFGTKKLKSMGTDLGGALKGFKKSMGDEEEMPKTLDKKDADTIEGEAEEVSSSDKKSDK
ncbi:MAG: twin-arginine translocase TatA/TatE family subunit [Pseudomonadales bacterium]|nr:twin-arginine translocase TatA/TatE family subunit [Pseudomonadales bacterium]